MQPRRFHPFPFLLTSILLLTALLAGCQKAAPTTTAGEDAEKAPPTATFTSAPPTATSTPLPTLPATWTPKPVAQVKTPTTTPTFTATPNNRQTLAAATQLAVDYPCTKYQDAWQIRLENSWRSYWCYIDGDPITYYEYNLEFPSAWKVNTFGDRHPNLIFVTGSQDIEVRFYQVYAYETVNYDGTLENAPATASFCEKGGGCTPVVDPLERVTRFEKRKLGFKDIVVLDGTDGKRSVRRYFFIINFFNTFPKSNRLFMVKVYTPKPINAVLSGEIEGEEPYAELMKQLEDMILSVRPDVNRVMTPWPTVAPTK